MTKFASDGATRVYGMVERWVNVGLRSDGSLFTPDRSVWALDVIDEFHERHVLAPKPDGGTFESSLLDQLSGATATCWQFAAETIYVHFLIVSERAVGQTKKLALIDRLLAEGTSGVSVPEKLRSVMADGFVHPGQGFNQTRHAQVGFLTEFVRAFKGLPTETRERAVQDPWEFKQFALSVEPHGGHVMRNSLLHLVHPRTFERVVVGKAKRQIVKRFADYVTTEADDEDRQLLDVRAGLTATYGDGFDFYEPDLLRRWQPDTTAWGRFVTWAAKLYGSADFEERERTYKIEIASSVRTAIDARDAEALTKALRSGKNNLLPPMNKVRLRDWIREDPQGALDAFVSAIDGSVGIGERLRRFDERFPTDVVAGLHSRARVLAFALLVGDAEECPPYQLTPYIKAMELSGSVSAELPGDPAAACEQGWAFLDRFVEEAAARGLDLRDRLDAQGLAYWLASAEPPEHWDDADRRAFLRWRGEAGAVDDDAEGNDDAASETRPHGDLAALSERLHLGAGFLPQVGRLLDMKPQVIFYGPPGTGKTYVAQRLAEAMVASDGFVEIVQFHPSYAYEDFVEGYRPDPERAAFKLVDGPLKRLARRAIEHADAPHVLIIDELNRGNVAKVFGELYFLLEYRGSRLSLQYSSEPFRLPDNLFVIGTMNTADRSIALVDSALRRRFYFVPFMTDEAPVNQVLRRWIADQAPRMAWVADVVDEANRRLADRHASIGPSHFMSEDGLTEESVEIAWKYSILPYLEEQLYSEPERLTEFGLDRLRGIVDRQEQDQDDAPTDAS